MKEARDHSRVSKEGKNCGAVMSALADKGALILAAEGEPDERCKTCAFTSGTVPNGCIQTQMDAMKSVIEKVPFYCHAKFHENGSRRLCHGWYAANVAVGRVEQSSGEVFPIDKCPWEFSPPDDDNPARAAAAIGAQLTGKEG